ncbi:MAG: trimethylamine methyltransferase family protein [Pseudomonadota bacterium]
MNSERSGRVAQRRRRKVPNNVETARTPPPVGGRLRPLSAAETETVIDAAFAIVGEIGFADCAPHLIERACMNGARLRSDGRLTFPRAMVEDALRRTARTVALPGFTDDTGLEIGGGRVHIGTGGAAVEILDADAMMFRDAGLADLYRLMRIVGVSDNIHYGVRPVVARDMATPLELDLNTAFACMKATSKPIGVSFDSAEHVVPVTQLFDMALGRDDGFRARPFCFAVTVHVVPPLRFASEGLAIMEAAIAAGMPLQICTAAQAGATSPVTLAGALAQGLAECLGGLMIVDLIRPGFPCIFAFMPFISDLRTGAMTGGSGEAAVANAAAAQLMLDLGLPSTVSAGMTDAKLADAQSGYEKGYTVALAAQAGADMINLSVGMLGSIMAASPEALVIDNDMCGAILRSVRGIEMPHDAIDLDMIERVVTGPGHYLGEDQTLALMKSEYTYPDLGDRQSIADWTDDGAKSIWQRARQRVAEIDKADPPSHLPADREARIRVAFPIHLPAT